MKIIDEYRTPDGRYEYRVEDDNGVILPPMSFKTEQSKAKLQTTLNKIIEAKSSEQTVEMVTITKAEYEDLKTKSEAKTIEKAGK